MPPYFADGYDFNEPINKVRVFYPERLWGSALMVYHLLLAKNVSQVWCQYDCSDVYICSDASLSFVKALAGEEVFTFRDLVPDLAPRGLGELGELSWHLQWAWGALTVFAEFLNAQFQSEEYEDVGVLQGTLRLDLVSCTIEIENTPQIELLIEREEPAYPLGLVSERVFYEFGIEGREADTEEEIMTDNEPEIFDDRFGIFGSADDEDWQWEEAGVSLGNLSKYALWVRDILIERGISEVGCQYTWFSDETHGRFDSALLRNVRLFRLECIRELEQTPLGDMPSEKAQWYDFEEKTFSRSFWVMQALDRLAEALSLQILSRELRLPTHFYVDLLSELWRPMPPDEQHNNEGYEEWENEERPDEFWEAWQNREPAKAILNPEELSPLAAKTYRFLAEQGVTQLLCCYSSSEDEGPASIVSATLFSEDVGVLALVNLFPQNNALENNEGNGDAKRERQRRWQFQGVIWDLDRLASELVAQLFRPGTGEGSVGFYGQGHFSVHLQTNELIEDPSDF